VTNCTVAGTRVIRAEVADSFRTIPMYRGEYHLRYVVSGHEYYVWAKSEWADVDRHFVQDRVGAHVDQCDFLIRYNPIGPSDAIAVRK
jgi:hypothetical protein